jgi:hypothetical protein
VSTEEQPDEQKTKSKRRMRIGLLAVASLALELAVLRRRGYGLGGRVIVRCRAGHLFTTIWLPAASLKSLRLGLWRVQRCPVGHHWSLVTPVSAASLSEAELSAARQQRDLPIP